MAREFFHPAVMFGFGVILVMLSLTSALIFPMRLNINLTFIAAFVGVGLSTLGVVRLLVRT